MSDTPLEELTLRQRLSEAERMLADLQEHLDRNFLTKLGGLRRVVKDAESTGDEIPDSTVREASDELIKSEFFTDELYKKLELYLTSINHSVENIVGHPQDDPLNTHPPRE